MDNQENGWVVFGHAEQPPVVAVDLRVDTPHHRGPSPLRGHEPGSGARGQAGQHIYRVLICFGVAQ